MIVLDGSSPLGRAKVRDVPLFVPLFDGWLGYVLAVMYKASGGVLRGLLSSRDPH